MGRLRWITLHLSPWGNFCLWYQRQKFPHTDYFPSKSQFVWEIVFIFCLMEPASSDRRVRIRKRLFDLTCAQTDAHKSKVTTLRSSSSLSCWTSNFSDRSDMYVNPVVVLDVGVNASKQVRLQCTSSFNGCAHNLKLGATAQSDNGRERSTGTALVPVVSQDAHKANTCLHARTDIQARYLSPHTITAGYRQLSQVAVYNRISRRLLLRARVASWWANGDLRGRTGSGVTQDASQTSSCLP